MMEQLEENIAEAAKLYRRVGGSFQSELRGLAGHREAVRRRLEVVRTGGTIEVPVIVTTSYGTPLPLPSSQSKPGMWKMTTEHYFAGVPARFRDPDRLGVQRHVQLQFPASGRESTVGMQGIRAREGPTCLGHQA
jgi:hypothetical protein